MNKCFVEALENHDLRALEKISKGNMHSHAGKGANVNFLGKKTGVKIGKPKSYFYSLEAMHQWYSRNIGMYCKGIEGLLLRWEGCFAEAQRDSVSVMVQSFSSDVVKDVGGMKKFMNILDVFHQKYCPDTLFLPELTFPRSCDTKKVMNCLEEILSYGYFKSLDICFDEFAQPIHKFKSIYRLCEKNGMVVKAHVGEFGKPDDVIEAVETLHLQEIYHGISVTKSENAMKWLRDKKIVLNLCPTSNLYMGLVDSYANHPIRKLYDNGICVTICTDDLLIFQSSLSEEYLKLYESGVMTAEELDDIRKNALVDAVQKRYEV